jgi:hypothetical protein
MKSRWMIAPVILALALFSTSAEAGNPREHDGFFLRLSAGGAHASTELDAGGTEGELELSGPSADFNFAVGGVIAKNLAIHGTFFSWYVEDPDAEFEGGVIEGEGEVDGDLDMFAWGGGLTYYFMPVNIYVSASVGAATLSLETDDAEVDSDTGIAGDLTLGKEWWVGNSWGLGVAGAMGLHSIPDDEIDESWSGMSFAVRFSATFN